MVSRWFAMRTAKEIVQAIQETESYKEVKKTLIEYGASEPDILLLGFVEGMVAALVRDLEGIEERLTELENDRKSFKLN